MMLAAQHSTQSFGLLCKFKCVDICYDAGKSVEESTVSLHCEM